MAPTVSINLCCYNSEKYLRETLDSIVNQTYNDWELIIINDGSSDSTESIVYEYINQGFPIIYHYQENKGLGYSRNEALKRSQGEFIAFIDHDDIWLPEKLEKQIPLFDKNPGVGLVICDTIFFNKKGDVKQLYVKKKPPIGNVFRNLLTGYFISLETAVLRRVALSSLDEWFDPRFNMIEEADLFTRIAYNWELGYVDEPLAKWRMHHSSLTFCRKELFPKEKELMIAKFCKIYKDFAKEYKKEINIIKSQVEINYALLDWEQGEKIKARKRLKPYLTSSLKCKLLYLLSFFPFAFYRQLYKIRGINPL